MTMFDPFADVTRLRHQISRLLDDAPAAAKPLENGRVFHPSVDLFENEDALELRLDLPGVDRNKIDVQLTGDELVVRAERLWVKPAKGGCLHQERPHGQFMRVLRLPIAVQHDAVEANYRDGVLTVHLPKAETLKPRRVAVRTEESG